MTIRERGSLSFFSREDPFLENRPVAWTQQRAWIAMQVVEEAMLADGGIGELVMACCIRQKQGLDIEGQRGFLEGRGFDVRLNRDLDKVLGASETSHSQRERKRKDSWLISCPPSWRELFRGMFIVDSSSASIGVLFYSIFTDSWMMIANWE